MVSLEVKCCLDLGLQQLIALASSVADCQVAYVSGGAGQLVLHVPTLASSSILHVASYSP